MARVIIDIPNRVDFRTSIDVRITDLNYAAHLANNAVLGLAHELRMKFLAEFDASENEFFGVGLIMTDAAIVYKSQGYYGDTLDAEISCEIVSSVGFELFYRLKNAESGKEVARIKTGMVCFDYKANKIAKLPEEFRDALERLS
ncbi:MAG: esterase [Ectothiorhodospiraceae bacterium]|nr:esterase [Ectothiorhodospiraceae bacterium]